MRQGRIIGKSGGWTEHTVRRAMLLAFWRAGISRRWRSELRSKTLTWPLTMFATYALFPLATLWMPAATGIVIAGARNSRTMFEFSAFTTETDPATPNPLKTFGKTIREPSEVIHCPCGWFLPTPVGSLSTILCVEENPGPRSSGRSGRR